jgi:hypothetical protein
VLQKKARKTRMRWLDDVESDLKKMEVKGWKEKMRDRKQWRLVVEGAKLTQGSSADWQAGRMGGTRPFFQLRMETSSF